MENEKKIKKRQKMTNTLNELIKKGDKTKDIEEKEIIKDLEIIQVIAGDIESQNELIETTNDPELSAMYNQSLLHSLDIYNSISEDVYSKLKKYLDRCKKEDKPIETGYYRIYRALRDDFRNHMKKRSV